MRPKPLSGSRVLDLTRLLPGPVCTLHLADLGADVIKIEDTGAGDYARTLGAEPGKTAPVFAAINRNKRARGLDLKQRKGGEVFLGLCATPTPWWKASVRVWSIVWVWVMPPAA